MRHPPPFYALLLLASCGSDQVLDYDLENIELARAPIEPGGAATGGLLAKVTTSAGVQPYLIDSAYPLNSLARAGCASAGTPGWTYAGTVELRDGSTAGPVRAVFKNVGLFDVCPGPTGDAATQPAGVMGGSLLANFAVGFSLPTGTSTPATMTLWPGFPGSDDELAFDGLVSLRFNLRGSATAAQGNGEPSLTLPNSRIVLAACAAPRAFSTTEAPETCSKGEVALTASGASLLLAVGTGEGPVILSDSAWARVAPQMGVAADTGTAGDLFTPFTTTATPARFLTLPRLALFQGTTDSSWVGACAELARARRAEWVFANQQNGACFQACDVNGGQLIGTHPYVELGGSLRLAVVKDDTDLIRALNVDTPPNPRVDGIVGAAALTGLKLRFDYPAQPRGRVVAGCLDTSDRTTCYTAPGCPSRTAVCFGQTEKGSAPACP
jgi:hypothetical protein